MIDTTIIIVNYNCRDYLNHCLHLVMAQTYKRFNVILVDNNSKDDSIERVKKYFAKDIKSKKLIILKEKKNQGFAEANNIGIRYALSKYSLKYIALLNPDAFPLKTWLKHLINAKETTYGDLGMLTPQVISTTGGIDTLGLRLNSGLLGFDIKDPTYRKLICPSGVAALYCVDFLNDIERKGEYFDKEFFMYCEDLDLGIRGQMLGYKCYCINESIVYHMKGASQPNNKKALYYCHRNNVWTIYKNYDTLQIIKKLIPILFYQFATLLYHIPKGNFCIIWKAKIDAIKGLKKMKKKRKENLNIIRYQKWSNFNYLYQGGF